jgi:hypothetical protein
LIRRTVIGQTPVVRLTDAGLTVNDIDLGSVDAEADTRLADYFVTAPYVRYAFQGRRTLFLGRKGSGKSGLFTQLPRLANESADPDRTVSLITPDQYSWSALKEYQEQGLLAEQAHTNAWKLTLGIEVAGALLRVDKDWTPAASEALSKLRKFLTDNFGTISPGLLRTATSMVKGLKSLNFSAFGFGAGMSREPTFKQALTPAVADELLRLARFPLGEHRLVLGLDRLDDSWDGSEEAKSLLVGLLKASKELNDGFGVVDGDFGLRVDVFLRSDIYDSLRFDDKDKHRAVEQHITWTLELLKEMVERRLPNEVSVDDLFEPGDMRGSISPFNYIVKRTFLRPREVLQFLEECMRQAGNAADLIRKDDIRRAEERYSGWKVADLKQEYSKVFPQFDRLLESLRQEVHRYDSLNNLEELLRRKTPDLVEAMGARALMETLFECSVIGVRLSDAGSTRYKSEEIELALPQTGAVYVHQSLYKGLNIRETRRAAEDTAGNPHDRLSVDLYGKMMSALPIQDLTFFLVQPTTVSVLTSETFKECARSLGLDLIVDHAGEITRAVSRPNVIFGDRFELNSETYRSLRGEMIRLVNERGFTVEEYILAERRASKMNAR